MTGVTWILPFRSTAPILGLMEQDVARVEVQVRVVCSPTLIRVGSAVKVAVGAIWRMVTDRVRVWRSLVAERV